MRPVLPRSEPGNWPGSRRSGSRSAENGCSWPLLWLAWKRRMHPRMHLFFGLCRPGKSSLDPGRTDTGPRAWFGQDAGNLFWCCVLNSQTGDSFIRPCCRNSSVGDLGTYLDTLAAQAHPEGGWGYAPANPSIWNRPAWPCWPWHSSRNATRRFSRPRGRLCQAVPMETDYTAWLAAEKKRSGRPPWCSSCRRRWLGQRRKCNARPPPCSRFAAGNSTPTRTLKSTTLI